MIQFKKMPLTYTVMAICIIVFLCIHFLPLGMNSTNMAILFGAYYKAFISAGEIWRLLTVGFVHIELWHLVMNMAVLYTLGSVLEKYYGSFRFGIILALSTITGSLVSFIGEGNTLMVGLSGGLYGLMAAEIMMIIKSGLLQSQAIRRSLIQTLLINLCINFMPGIGVLAHFGGFLIGILLSFAFDVYALDLHMQKTYRICTICLLCVLCVFACKRKAINENDIYLGTDIAILQFEKDHHLGWYVDKMTTKLEKLYNIDTIHYYLH